MAHSQKTTLLHNPHASTRETERWDSVAAWWQTPQMEKILYQLVASLDDTCTVGHPLTPLGNLPHGFSWVLGEVLGEDSVPVLGGVSVLDDVSVPVLGV